MPTLYKQNNKENKTRSTINIYNNWRNNYVIKNDNIYFKIKIKK